MKLKLSCLLAVLAIFTACNKDDDSVGEPAKPQLAQLEVTVRLCDSETDPLCHNLQPVNGASVYLFEHEQLREDGVQAAFHGTTGANGKLFFNTLDTSQYWITVTLPPPDSRSQKIYENDPYKTPLRALTFLDIVFEEE
jgi:hypothetical protein